MDPQIKAQWVEALRSDRYTQGKDALEQDGNFCCLGVLCDLAVQAGVAVRGEGHSGGGKITYRPAVSDSIGGGSDEELPKDVALWAGLGAETNPEVPDPDDEGDGEELARDLADLNDRGTPFAVIADLIEEHL